MTNHSLLGQTVGKYQIVESLGRGGMAEVYKAYQENLDRFVAIKVMHSFLADEQGFLARFQREAKAMASLNHNNIVAVFDFDVQDGMYYIVMEFVGGGTLKQRLEMEAKDEGQIPLYESVQLVMEVADALAYAHDRGMVHRDIKPGNIMLNEQGHAILTDFGIAKILSGPTVTATGAMIGTPAYMSPEQGLGQPGDERSDLYALGVLFYQMVTGHLPYDADTPLAVILKHVNEPVPHPAELSADLPPDIQAVIIKSMAKDPGDRYQTAQQMMAELQAAAKANNLAFVGGAVFSALRDHPTPAPATIVAETRYAQPEATIVASKKPSPVAATRVAAPSSIAATEIATPAPVPMPEKKKSRLGIIVAVVLVLLGAGLVGGFFVINGLMSNPTPTPEVPGVVVIEETPTDEPTPVPTEEILPTADNVSTAVALIAATLTAQPTNTPKPTSTATATPTKTPDLTATFIAGCEKDIELVKSYTFDNQNNSSTPANINFTMNWILKNSGTCSLPKGLKLKYQEGEAFQQTGTVLIDAALAPGDEVTISTKLVAPNRPGKYVSSWQVVDGDDNPIGAPIEFEISVFEPTTPTPKATNTPVPSPTSVVTEAFGYHISTGSCEYVGNDWECQLIVTPYGGRGPYVLTISDASPPSRYEGNGPFTHSILSRRCDPWVNTITVRDDGTGQELSEPRFFDPNNLIPGGCQRPAP